MTLVYLLQKPVSTPPSHDLVTGSQQSVSMHQSKVLCRLRGFNFVSVGWSNQKKPWHCTQRTSSSSVFILPDMRLLHAAIASPACSKIGLISTGAVLNARLDLSFWSLVPKVLRSNLLALNSHTKFGKVYTGPKLTRPVVNKLLPYRTLCPLLSICAKNMSY